MTANQILQEYTEKDFLEKWLMFRKLSLVLAVFFVFFVLPTGYIAFAPTATISAFAQIEGATTLPHSTCEKNVFAGATQFAFDKFAKTKSDASAVMIVEWNDFMCDGPELMGNVVIVYSDTVRGTLFGIFHVHSSPDGAFKSAVSINDKEWTPLTARGGWKEDWCGFLKTVYPEDFARQCVNK